MALGLVPVGAWAGAGCPAASAEDLLAAAPAGDGFVLARRLCATTLVRRRAATAPLPGDEADAAPQPPPVVATPVPPAAPKPPVLLSAKDPAGQARVRALAPLMADVAQRHDIDPLLLHAVAHIESRHQSQAISPAGARGLMQVMPATGRGLGVADAERQLLTPQANLEASARYLKQLQARFGNDLALVLAAYNAGEGAVERHGRRVPPFAETQAYVRNVLAVYAELRRRLGAWS
ncbi:lytic transglycosylase domain-containing protein [Roseateles sp. DXS20W]|uniref:Lytic transglycosylase domain-containing protein n=1 Tax=Pelomonas lactea TaxID=3299030 RepID=A0ABW7GFN3_9BURK